MNFSTAVRAETGSQLVLRPTFFVAKDNEDFETRRIGVDLLSAARTGDAYMGARFQHLEFRQGQWSRSGKQVAGVMKGKATTGHAWHATAGLLQQGGHTLLTLDGNIGIPLTERMSAEIFVNRDVVETRDALDRGIHFTFAGASADYLIHPKLTLVGLAGHQRFSDDNRRNHGRLRMIFQPDLDLGLTFQYRFRYYSSTPNTSPRGYFNPERYQEHMLLSGWRTRRNGWVMSLLGGLGRQKLDGAPSNHSRLAELSLDSPVDANQQIRIRAGYVQTASFGGPDYRYPYLQGQWVIKFW